LAITNTLIDARPKGIENGDGKLLVAGRAMREGCTSRHRGPFSIGIHRTGQFRCENCDAVLSGVEVYLDTTEHAADGKQAQRALKFSAVPVEPGSRALSTLESLGSMY
jgi:hypothetical protein